MKAIIFIDSYTSGSSSEAFTAAAELGYAAILVTNRKSFIRRRDEFPNIHHIDLLDSMDEESIRKAIARIQQAGYVIGVIASFVDPYVAFAAKLSNELCNTIISTNALGIMEDKIATRIALRENPANCRFEAHGLGSDKLDWIYPFILKEPVSNGSKDVYFIENEEQLKRAESELNKRFMKTFLLKEDYVEGTQYAIELIVANGWPIITAVVKQQITAKAPYIVTGYELITQLDEAIYLELWNAVQSICKDVGLRQGACHMEMRFSKNGWKLIEMNPRIAGGAMNRMIETAFGINLVKETLKLYLGEEPDLVCKGSRPVYTTYITIDHYGWLVGIEGVDLAFSIPGIVDVHVKPTTGMAIVPPISMGQRYGYVMAVGETGKVARERAIHAARLIKFYIDLF